MNVPFLDLSHQTRAVADDFLAEVRRLVEQGRFVGGEPVDEFEQAFAGVCGSRFCVALNSGTDALRLALLALGVGPGDEVITTPFTFIATSEAVHQSSGRLVFADVDPSTFTLSPASVEERISDRTRVLLPVHIFGLPANMEALGELARRRSLGLIEDCAQAHGGTIRDRPAGSLADSAAFSFYPSKNLGAFGDAGALTTDDEAVAARVRLLRNHGQVAPYLHDLEGYNSRLDSIQAVVLRLKLRFLSGWIEERRSLAFVYRRELAELEEVRFQSEPEGFRHSYYLLGALVQRRSELIEHLHRQGIEARVIYPEPLHLQKAYQSLGYRPGELPHCEEICRQVLCFPLYPGLGEERASHVARSVRRFYEG